jgi:protein gp37
MSDKTSIEWTRGDDGSAGATWNPLTGCEKVSPGCDHCYAETLAERFRGTPGHYFESGFNLTLRPERLDQPLRWRKPRRIFVNSMSDLFHKDVPDEFIARVFAVMALAPQHTFQLLTKRHARMRALLSSPAFTARVADAAYLMAAGEDPNIQRPALVAAANARAGFASLPSAPAVRQITWPLLNVWLGVSVEDQQWADIRIPALLETPAAVRWISAEPLLGPIDLSPYLTDKTELYQDLDGTDYVASYRPQLDWVVAGGESGPGARPMHPAWARSLRDQCEETRTAFLLKQWGSWIPYEALCASPRDLWVHLDGTSSAVSMGAPQDIRTGTVLMRRVSKKAAGRLLDGRTHDGYPAVARA